MPLTRLIYATAATALIAGAAHAQDTVTATEGDVTVTTTTVAVDSTAGLSAAALQAGVEADAVMESSVGAPGTLTLRVVTNGPIPDTPENRAKYGEPNSRAGRATDPAGN